MSATEAKLAISIGQHSDAGRKPINQDFHGAMVPVGSDLALKGIAVAVADGLSSSTVSQIAAEIAVKSLLTDYYLTADTWTTKKAGERVIRAANAWLQSESRRNWLYDNQGYVCTLSAVIFKGRRAHVFHVGDARVYQLATGNLEPLTRDHRLVVSRTESHLSRALGINPHVEIDYLAVDLQPGDVFVLATDGVHEFVSARDTAAVIAASDDLQTAARTIVAAALANGSDDNTTIQIVRVDGLPDAQAQDVFLGADIALAAEVPRIPYDLDGFKIVREIHSTNRSTVYVAIDADTREQVVVKVLASELRGNAGARRRFAMEEWVARRLDSPHIVKAAPITRQRNSLYTVSEFIDGQTLRQWMLDNPKPALQAVREIIEQIAKGLQAFHRKEMLHQDIRPENIMIDTTGTVKIIDLGSVRIAGVHEAMPASQMGDVLGTHQYAAPEYFIGQAVSDRSDMYSLGVIAYEMLTGVLPYGEDVARATTPKAQAHLFYISAVEVAPRVPAWMDLALRKAVSVDPAKRYDALSAFVADLSQPGDAFAHRPFKPLIERNPLLFWKALTAVLLLGVIGLLATR